jgi:septin family protein
MQDLQEVTHETHYENYRSEKLQPRKQLRANEIDTDEQQKKLIREKDDEVKYLLNLLKINFLVFSFAECKICSLKCKVN